MKFSNLLFLDDTLIFGQATKENITYLTWMLMWFEAIAGLKANLHQSELFTMGKLENGDTLASFSGNKNGKPLSIYWGMHLDAKYNSKGIKDEVEEKMRKEAIRKRQYISKGED